MKGNNLRCHAKSKRSGVQCKSWAVKGKRVCRMHGAFAGIKTEEGRKRQVDAVTKHGKHTKKAIAERKEVSEMIKEAKSTLSSINV